MTIHSQYIPSQELCNLSAIDPGAAAGENPSFLEAFG